MKWRGSFFAYYYGRQKVRLDEPHHVMDPCPPPEQFYEGLYKGAGGYRKVLDLNGTGRRLVVFESDSGEWHLLGTEDSA